MTDEARDGDDHADASAPWERPRRWNTQRLDATRVDDLLARLGTTPTEGRRRRRESDEPTDTVSASSLIAALSESADPQPADDDRTTRFTPPPPAATPSTPAPAVVTPPPAITPPTPTPAAAVLGPPAATTAGPPTDEATTVTPRASIAAATVVSRSASDEATTVLTPSADSEPTVLLANLARAPQPMPDDSHTEIIPRIAEPASEADSIRALLAGSAATAGAHATAGQTAAPTETAAPALVAADPHRTRRIWLRVGRSVVVVVAALTLVVTGLYWDIIRRAANGLQDNQVTGALSPDDTNIVKPTAKPVVPVGTEKVYQAENILLLGSDSRAGANGNAGNSDDSTMNSAQSDTMMIAHLAADRRHVTVLSFPRDTVVPAPTCKQWDFKTGKYSDQDVETSEGQLFKLTNTYAVGGPRCVVSALQQVTGIKIDRYIGIDFSGFKSMVDALGGITINTCGPIVDGKLGTITDHGGVQTFRGEPALSLVRARSVDGEHGADLARISRQQAVLSAILRQVTSAGTMTSPGKLNAFLQAFTTNTFTEKVTLNTLIELAGSLGDLSPQAVTFYTLPTYASQRRQGDEEIDETKAPAIFDAIINDQPLPGQQTAPTTKPTTTTTKATPKPTPTPQMTLRVDPADVPLRVYNLTGENGVAGKAMASLNEIGFEIVDDDLVRPEDDTRTGVTVEYPAALRDAALTVATAVPGSTLVLNPGLSGEVRLMLGSSFDGTVKAVKLGDRAPASLTSVSTASSAPSTDSGDPDNSTSPAASTLKSTDVASLNAATAGCVGPHPSRP